MDVLRVVTVSVLVFVAMNIMLLVIMGQLMFKLTVSGEPLSLADIVIPRDVEQSQLECRAVFHPISDHVYPGKNMFIRTVNFTLKIPNHENTTRVKFPDVSVIHCTQTTLIPSSWSHNKTNFVSFPRSGSHVFHYLIATATGFAFGTQYEKELSREKCAHIDDAQHMNDASLMFVKTHYPVMSDLPSSLRTILLVRNPISAIVSYSCYERAFQCSYVYIDRTLRRFERFSEYWLPPKDVRVLRWENILYDFVPEIERAVRFLDLPVRSNWVSCLNAGVNPFINKWAGVDFPSDWVPSLEFRQAVEPKHIYMFDGHIELFTNISNSRFIREFISAFNYTHIIEQSERIIRFRNNNKKLMKHQ